MALLGHLSTMISAGGAAAEVRGTQFGEYESVSGTGQVHIWFNL